MTAFVAAFLFPFGVLAGFFALEIALGLLRSRATIGRSRASAVVVVPAHDEEAVIGQTLRSLRASLGEQMRVLVVADNCSDATAEQARLAGVEVVERRDALRQGKGYALAAAAEHLQASPPDVVVVLDADCSIDASSLATLVETTAALDKPCQAVNLLRPDQTKSPLVQLSTFAFVLKNKVRQRGLQRLAGRVHLTGTGMAVPFRHFSTSRLATASIVEDLALGLDLAENGDPPQFVDNATVWSSGSSEQGTLLQRRRWEGGFISVSLRHGPKAVLRGIAKGRLRTVLAGMDLMVPPLALFALLNAAALLLATVMTLTAAAAWWPVLTQVLLLAGAGLAVLAAWFREGRDFVSLNVLLRLPMYILWKLPLYLSLGRRGVPREWLRTGR